MRSERTDRAQKYSSRWFSDYRRRKTEYYTCQRYPHQSTIANQPTSYATIWTMIRLLWKTPIQNYLFSLMSRFMILVSEYVVVKKICTYLLIFFSRFTLLKVHWRLFFRNWKCGFINERMWRIGRQKSIHACK